jgi:hypothetical protein
MFYSNTLQDHLGNAANEMSFVVVLLLLLLLLLTEVQRGMRATLHSCFFQTLD